MVAFQGSLLSDPSPAVAGVTVRRRELARGAWIDHAPGWLAGGDTLFTDLVDGVAWGHRRVHMYERELDEPRLTASLGGDALGAFPVLADVIGALQAHYEERFTSCWMNLYRDGRDSVAWHGDRVAREQLTGLVAIVSVGERRPFRLRPKGGGPSIGYDLGRGDLLVMGGTCQRTWDHAVPKVARAGPRISLTFRPVGLEDPPLSSPSSRGG